MITKRISFGNSRREIHTTKGEKFFTSILIGIFLSFSSALRGKWGAENVLKAVANVPLRLMPAEWLLQGNHVHMCRNTRMD
jgi:hypothetical protein